MARIDFNNSKSIDYSEFLVAAVDLKTIITEENLKKTFRFIDTDGNGSLSVTEIKSKLGDNISEEYYAKLLKHFNAKGNGEIDYQEFSSMMRDILLNY